MSTGKGGQTQGTGQRRGRAHKSEYEQAIIRLVLVASASLYYLVLNYEKIHTGGIHVLGLIFGVSYFLVSVLIFSHVTLSENIHPRFHTLCMLIDVGVTSVAMYLLAGYGVVLLTFYTWLTVGNGFRYGHRELILCALFSLAGFLTMILFTPYWRENALITITGIILLTVIPVYVALMLRRFEELRSKLEASSDEKSRFLANISHEIRTPLNAIVLSSHVLKDEVDMAKKDAIIRDISESGETLRNLVDNVLDFSRLESREVSLKIEPFNIYQLLLSVESVIRQSVDRKGLDYMLDLDMLTPPEVYGDRENIRQIIVNLVSNAVKFTEKGRVVFSVRPIRLDDGMAQMRFEVRDTGIGISRKEQKGIFERFRQVDDSTSRRYGGTGLGTSISKQLVEKMGGEIGVESEPGKGSLFWFSLPLRVYQDKSGLLADGGSLQVHIVSNGQDDMSHLRGEIESSGLKEITLYPTLEAAVQALERRNALPAHPVCLLVAMDDVCGKFELLDQVTVNNRVPVVCFDPKGSVDRTGHGRGSSLFAITYHKSLVSNIRNLCGVFSGSMAAACGADVKSDSACDSEGTAFHALVADDSEINRRVLQRLLDRYNVQTTIVDNGYDALKELRTGCFDLAFIDIQMPDITGIDVIREYLIDLEDQMPIPIAVLTGDATADTREECEKYDIRYFLTKPVSPLQLRDLVYDMAHPGGLT